MTQSGFTGAGAASGTVQRDASPRRATHRFPDDGVLADVLSRMLHASAISQGVQIVGRDRTGRFGRYADEIVTCVLDDGSTLRLLCKYAPGNDTGSGERRGIEYEIRIYRDILHRADITAPRFYGSHHDIGSNQYWLVLEYIPGGLTIARGPQPATLISAAQLIGKFHRTCAGSIDELSTAGLIEYDVAYFSAWAQRVLSYADEVRADYPWLDALCGRWLEFAPELLTYPRTLIHGELTVGNVLLRDGKTTPDIWRDVAAGIGGVPVAPIDWESAAISFGEIDLAFLLDGSRPEATQLACVEQYRRHRYAGQEPDGFDTRFRAAQLYMHFRWLAEGAAKTRLKKSALRFGRMEQLGRELGLI
jgi:aminoglycoside phosphotransferase (APT) family kinase protein